MIRCIGQANDLPFAQLRKKFNNAERKAQCDEKMEKIKAALNCLKANLEEENKKYKAQIVDLKIGADKNQELKALEHNLTPVKVEEEKAIEIPKADDLQEKKKIVGFMLNSEDAEAIDVFIRGLEHLSLENFVQAVAKKYNDSLVQLN